MNCTISDNDTIRRSKPDMQQDKKRETIASVFIEMLNDTPLESLRIEDLCAKAHVSKSTFYRLFRDKYDLAFWIYKKHSNEMVLGRPELSSWDEWTYHDCAHILKYKSFYRNIAAYRGQNCLYDCLAKFYRGNITNFRKNKEKPLTEDQKYAVYMHSLVCAQVMIDWILNGFEPSPEEMIHRAELCIPNCLRDFYE